MSRRILFVDRDGTLIVEPSDFQIDDLAKFRLVDDLIVPLKRLVDAGYELVMVSNQDGLGTDSFPEATFWPPQNLLLQVLESQGIRFSEVLIDRHFAHQQHPDRKPGVGMVLHWLRDTGWDRARSAMVGDRSTDLEFADRLGVRGFQLQPGPWTWPAIARELLDAPRQAVVERTTKETRIRVAVDLDAEGPQRIHTGLGFFDHMLEQLGRHGGFALDLHCEGDLHIDEHHTVEDSALALGTALKQALGDKRGIGRYGFTLPMDETLASAAIDLSGRAWLEFEGHFSRERVGELPTELVGHFFRSVCDTLGANLHLKVSGENCHHMVEACFKVVARTLRQAFRREGESLPSTKGVL
jgi:imidazoleglycerol-phosphate dehydratase / histidinol-phosphatase